MLQVSLDMFLELPHTVFSATLFDFAIPVASPTKLSNCFQWRCHLAKYWTDWRLRRRIEKKVFASEDSVAYN